MLRRLGRALDTRLHQRCRGDHPQGKPARSVFFIASGAVELETAGQTWRLGRGEMFGQMAILMKKGPPRRSARHRAFDAPGPRRDAVPPPLEAQPLAAGRRARQRRETRRRPRPPVRGHRYRPTRPRIARPTDRHRARQTRSDLQPDRRPRAEASGSSPDRACAPAPP